jgi:hypothetical protein
MVVWRGVTVVAGFPSPLTDTQTAVGSAPLGSNSVGTAFVRVRNRAATGMEERRRVDTYMVFGRREG